MKMDLLLGDCIEIMKTLPDKSVDLFICDLPYGQTGCKWDTPIDLDQFWKEVRRLKRSKSVACIMFCTTPFGFRLIQSNEKEYKMDLVWHKRNVTGGLQSKYRPMRNHEMLYFFYDKRPKYNRDKYHKRVACPATFLTTPGKTLWGRRLCPQAEKNNGEVWGWGDHKPHNHKHHEYEPPNPASVFKSGKVFIGKRNHQTEKPIDILEFLLKYWSDEGDTILDPTMGSGSTGVACKNLKREFIGIELDEKYFEVAQKRCS